ncbi:HU family DNA-binding protein [Tateyamaria sp.]|uniref:HU family DNA-binding protein n=1 Tax=Tateyamaria sp. TaxID=1929288 RepID=UPI0032A12799
MAVKTTKTTKAATSSTAKASTTSSAADSVAAAATPAPAKVVETAKTVVLGPMMRKPELVDAVVAKTGLKKKDVKPIVEATLALLGSALQDARELNLQPMGKIKVTRVKDKASGKLLHARIRQPQDLPSEVANPDPKDVGGDSDAPAAVDE